MNFLYVKAKILKIARQTPLLTDYILCKDENLKNSVPNAMVDRFHIM